MFFMHIDQGKITISLLNKKEQRFLHETWTHYKWIQHGGECLIGGDNLTPYGREEVRPTTLNSLVDCE